MTATFTPTGQAFSPASETDFLPQITALTKHMGRVYHQPIAVHSFTNKRFTVNFRVPLNNLRRILPEGITPDEIGESGYGMIGMCACDFWVTGFGWMPVPHIRNNDMLCRVSTKIRKHGQEYRAFYTIGSSSSSLVLGTLGIWFSHFRKQLAHFQRIDNEDTYALTCHSNDPLRCGTLRATMNSVRKKTPVSSIFANIEQATDFVFNLDGSCGYHFNSQRLSFQHIDYPKWDMYFCHEMDYDFPLMRHLDTQYGLQMEYDSVLFMQNTPQTWGASWLYHQSQGGRDA
ncbi:MAG: hypothetical protein AAF639_47645 [Chloroflexota bacterium]